MRTVSSIFQALEKYNIEKDIAAYIKKEFDKKYNPTWHCIVGRNFGARELPEKSSISPLSLVVKGARSFPLHATGQSPSAPHDVSHIIIQAPT